MVRCEDALVVVLTLFTLSVGLADEIAERSVKPQASGPAAPRPGSVPIFNGRDLTGWDADPRWWSAREDALVGQKADEDFPHHEYAIWAGGTVKDFELRLKFRPTAGNSGIDYRAERVWKDPRGNPVRRFVQGYQADIMRDVNTGALYNWRNPGAPYGRFVVVEGEREATFLSGEVADTEALHWAGYCKTGQWNDYTIVARGSHILHRINGFLVTEFIDNGPHARREGLLGVQIHGGDKPFLNEFKDIFLKRFSAPFGPARVLFNGKDLQGWITLDGEGRRTWNTIDGVLSSKHSGALVTTEKYADYVLRFQFRRPRVRRSGIVLRMAIPDQAVENRRGLAHFAESSEQNVPVPLSANGFRGSKCIRVSGEGDDFNWIRAIGGFSMEQREADKQLPALPELPEQFWNDCEITLNGGELEVKVNDIVRATATGCERVSGHIGFVNLDATTGIQYRNIVLIPIVTSSTTPDEC